VLAAEILSSKRKMKKTLTILKINYLRNNLFLVRRTVSGKSFIKDNTYIHTYYSNNCMFMRLISIKIFTARPEI
jgi:hypothetical protein